MNSLLGPLSRFFIRRSVRQQERTGLWSTSNWAAICNDSGRLEFDGVDLAKVVDDCGSPAIVVSKTKLLDDAAHFLNAMHSVFPEAIAGYSYKTNCIPGTLRTLHRRGFAAEVISPYELWLAEKLGVQGEKIIVNGVNKTPDFIDNAVRLRVRSLNIDEPGEVAAIARTCRKRSTPARISLRLKLEPSSHFGLDIASGEADKVAGDVAQLADVFDFQGLHFHLLADNDDPRKHVRYLELALEFAQSIKSRYGLETKVLNAGGGFTVPTMKVMSRWEYGLQRLFRVPCRPPDPDSGTPIEDYMRTLARAVEDACTRYRIPVPRMAFEPGRAVTSQSHVLLTRVHAIKANPSGPAFAMTDAGRILTSYPCDYEYHQMFVANRMESEPDHVYNLMGRLCTDADWLARYRVLPELQRGDVIAVMDAGAYFTSYSTNFAFPRPKIVMLDKGSITTLREQENFEHLTAMDMLDVDD